MAILSRMVSVTVNNAAPQVIGSRDKRRGVWIFPSIGSAITIAFGQTPVHGGNGLIIGAGVQPFFIGRDQFGPQVDQALSIVAAVNGTYCAVVEVFEA